MTGRCGSFLFTAPPSTAILPRSRGKKPVSNAAAPWAIRSATFKAMLYSRSRVIDVHIQHLRQKIGDNPAEPEYIVTVSGTRYKFNR